jgi:hypothetical protein
MVTVRSWPLAAVTVLALLFVSFQCMGTCLEPVGQSQPTLPPCHQHQPAPSDESHAANCTHSVLVAESHSSPVHVLPSLFVAPISSLTSASFTPAEIASSVPVRVFHPPSPSMLTVLRV